MAQGPPPSVMPTVRPPPGFLPRVRPPPGFSPMIRPSQGLLPRKIVGRYPPVSVDDPVGPPLPVTTYQGTRAICIFNIPSKCEKEDLWCNVLGPFINKIENVQMLGGSKVHKRKCIVTFEDQATADEAVRVVMPSRSKFQGIPKERAVMEVSNPWTYEGRLKARKANMDEVKRVVNRQDYIHSDSAYPYGHVASVDQKRLIKKYIIGLNQAVDEAMKNKSELLVVPSGTRSYVCLKNGVEKCLSIANVIDGILFNWCNAQPVHASCYQNAALITWVNSQYAMIPPQPGYMDIQIMRNVCSGIFTILIHIYEHHCFHLGSCKTDLIRTFRLLFGFVTTFNLLEEEHYEDFADITQKIYAEPLE